MKIIVTGGRNYSDAEAMRYALRYLWSRHNGDIEIYEGGALGADAGARWIRCQAGLKGHTIDADWNRYGASAGPIRNATMLREVEPDVVLAFPGGRGTEDMVSKARGAGVKVIEVV